MNSKTTESTGMGKCWFIISKIFFVLTDWFMWVRVCMRCVHMCVQIQKSDEEVCIVLGHSPYHPFETEPGGSQKPHLTLRSPSPSPGFTEMWVATSEIRTQTLVCAQKTTLTHWDIYPALIFPWFFYSHFTCQTTIWIWYSFFSMLENT